MKALMVNGSPHKGGCTHTALGIAGVALLAFAPGSTVAFYAAALCFVVYYGITNVMMPIFTRLSFGDRDYATRAC